MESVIRDVKCIESDERRVYESVLGHALQESQRVIIRVIELENEPDEAGNQASLNQAVEIARRSRAAAEAQGVTTDEADAAIDEAIQEARRKKH